MTLLIDATLRSSIVLLAGLAIRASLTKRSAAVRHLVLAIGLGAAAAVGPLSAASPSWTISMPAVQHASSHSTAQFAHSAGVLADAVRSTRHTPIAWPSVVFRLWLAGFLATAVVLAAGVLHVRRIAAHSRVVHDSRWLQTADAVANQYGLRRRIVLLQTSTPGLLATWGVFRPCVLLPSRAHEWSGERIYIVLCHELAHVRRFDWPIQTAAEMLRTMLWFNPLMWIACSLLRRDSEQACDDLVLGRGIAPGDYATQLLELARKCRPSARRPLPATWMARRSTLERRIADMLNPRIDRQFSIRTAGIASALLLAVIVPTAALRAAQTGPATLSGTVYDPTGAVMPGVTLTLVDVTQMKYEAQTGTGGRFAFSNVQPGHYTLEASLAGFRALKQEFDLAARSDWDRAITLQIGDLRERSPSACAGGLERSRRHRRPRNRYALAAASARPSRSTTSGPSIPRACATPDAKASCPSRR